MADRKISDLTALTTPASGDYLPIVDISEAAAASKNKRITIEELMRGVPDGTAAAPGIAFETDPNTGIYSPGADQLAVATNGTGRLFVDATGRVGIGATPTARLHLQTTSENAVLQMLENNGSTVYGASIDAFNSSGGNIRFRLHDSGGTFQERLRITSAGLVGIGSSAPGSRLTVNRVNSADASATGATTLSNAGITVEATTDTNSRLMFGIGSTGSVPWIQAQNTSSNATQSLILNPVGGNVGIGTTTPEDVLHLAKADVTPKFIIERTGSASAKWSISAGGNSFIFRDEAASAERARIDSSGRLLIGTSTARSNFHNNANYTTQFQLEGTGFQNSALSLIANNTAPGVSTSITLAKSAGAGLTSNTLVANNELLGDIRFEGSNGTNFVEAARIRCEIDGGTPGAASMPGRLVFSTTADGAAGPTERLRITSDAYVRLASGTGGIQFNGDTAAANALDDYEEGTFTPTIEGTTTAGTATYTRQAGVYTKVGRQVFYAIDVIYASGTGTGNLKIAGLPFTSGSITMIKTGAIYADNIALTAGNYPVVSLSLSSTVLLIQQAPTGGGAASSVPYDAAGQIIITGHYFV
jgi:hypothetical protein